MVSWSTVDTYIGKGHTVICQFQFTRQPTISVSPHEIMGETYSYRISVVILDAATYLHFLSSILMLY